MAVVCAVLSPAPASGQSPSAEGSAPSGSAATHTVGGPDGFATITEALAAAGPGDTVRVEPGVYREQLRVRRPVVLLGRERPVVDGGGEGHVVEATEDLVLRGFEIRGSGSRVDREHAGVMVRGGRAEIVDNDLVDVFYGVYLKDAPGSDVRDNRIRGKPLAPPRRGDGIRLWYSSGTTVVGNEVRRTRDVVVYFSDSLLVTNNVIAEGRYGLHYMYSNHNVFERNRFERNQVGAFIMYSRDVQLRHNVFSDATGASGMGLGLKDADDIVAQENLFVENASGIYLDNAPRERDAVNRFEANVLLYNRSGVRMLPSVRSNVFRGNSFVANSRPVEVSGGSDATQEAQNDWDGNHWSDYRGFDRDGDGIGDSPYVHARLSDDLMSRHPELELYALSPVIPAIEALSRFFPLLRPQAVVVDSHPTLAATALERWERDPPLDLDPDGTSMRGEGAPHAPPLPGALVAAGLTWAGVALLLGVLVVGGWRRRERGRPR